MSQPRMRLALPGPMRTLARSSADGAMRTWLMTAPFFCDNPVKSSVEHALPSTWAAMPSSAPMVMTPVPPMPVTRMLNGAVQRGRCRQRHIGEQRRRIGRGAIGLAQLAAMHGDEARAKAFDAGKILVAVRLVDPPLAAEFGFQRLHRDAIGGRRAIAAAFADALVDEDALRRIRIEPALAAAALFGGAGLVVDQDREALDLAQLLLHGVELAAVMDGRAGREIIGGYFSGSSETIASRLAPSAET